MRARYSIVVLCLVTSSTALASPSRSANFRFNPLGILAGIANLSLDLGFLSSVTLGPSGLYATRTENGVTATGYGIGGEMCIFLGHDRFTDSWVLSPFAAYQKASNDLGEAIQGPAYGANLEYDWFFGSGFNIGLGGGLEYVSLDYTKLGQTRKAGLWPSLTFTLGVSF
jgi:hypothetical protein